MQAHSSIVEIILAISGTVGLMAALSIGYGYVERYLQAAWLKSIIHGFAFSFAVFASMSNPHELMPGIQFDGRIILIGMAAAFGGLPAVILAVSTGIIMRLEIGGPGVIPGCVGMMVAAAAGLFWRHAIFSRERLFGIKELVILGGMTSTALFAIFLLPFDIALRVFLNGAPVIASANMVASVALGWFMRNQILQIRSQNDLLLTSQTDPLTGINNRRKFDLDFQKMVARGEKFGVFLIDIDHFKAINDTYGHQAGDDALKVVADLMRKAVRTEDQIYRVGGEEFAVLIPDVLMPTADKISDRIRKFVQDATVQTANASLNITVSIGVHMAGNVLADVGEVYRSVDAAVYQAKANGRNQVVFAPTAAAA